MADRIVTASMADRTPNWNKWRLMPNPELWQCVALSLNIDPYKVRRGSKYRMAGYRIFNESQEFQDRLEMACANLSSKGALHPESVVMGSPSYCTLSLREFAAWVQKIGREAPAELLAMADQEAAIKDNFTPGDKRTDAATAKRATRKKDRLEDLRRFIEDVYKVLENAGHEVGENGSRKPLPVSTGALHSLFLVRHPEHRVTPSTFADELPQIGVKLKPGRKRYTAAYLTDLMTGTFSG